uniref:G-protein coupled receptors family 3 profile domain-containing protein n=1 Tax=Latimeria chalumnae TaxID=7897 RepID=H3A9U1_LATCH
LYSYWMKMILYRIVFQLMQTVPLFDTAQPGCRLPALKTKGYIRDGDIIIGGIFPVHFSEALPESSFTKLPESIHCGELQYRYYRWLHGMVFAIEEINQNRKLLPNITLGFRIYDSCFLVQRATEGTIWLVTGHEEPIPNYRCQKQSPLAAILGDGPSHTSIPIARLLGIYSYPQISYASSAVSLSDKNEFPSFFRNIPSDDFQAMGLARLVMYFGWTWVGLLAEDTDYGQGIQIVKEEIVKAGGCIAFSEKFPAVFSKKVVNYIIQLIKRSSANAIVVFTNEPTFLPYMGEISKQNISGKVWISSEAWTISFVLSQKEYLEILSGTIGIMNRKGVIPGFQEYLYSVYPSKFPTDIFIKEFWEKAFDCKWLEGNSDLTASNDTTTKSKLCTGEEKLNELNNAFFDGSNLQYTYNVYTAVYTVAHALHDMYTCNPGWGPFVNRTCADILDFEPWQLLYYVKNVHFTNSDGMEVFFDKNGNPLPVYDILNWHISSKNTLEIVKVGSLDFSAPKGQDLIINESAIMWNGGHTQIPRSVCSESCLPGYRKAVHPGQPICCFDCVPCSIGEISNETDATECLKCPDDHWSNEKQDKCIPKTIEFLSFEEPMGAALLAITISCASITAIVLCIFVKYRDTPIVKANNRELSYLLLLAIMLSFLCSLIFIGEPRTETCMLRQSAFGIIFALCVSCVLAKTIMVVIAFNATKPNSKLKKWVGPKLSRCIVLAGTLIQFIICIVWLTSSPPFPEQNMKSQTGMIIIQCNEASTIAFWFVLGYMGILAIVSFIVAFLARNLPDSFNDAKFITFSMLVFVTVWLVFIPAYLSTRGKYMVAVEIFAILASSAGLLACIFFPKCYIILLRPEENTKEHLIGKNKIDHRKKLLLLSSGEKHEEMMSETFYTLSMEE